MPDFVDLSLTCLTVVFVAYVSEVSEPLAAAAATAPLTSTAALVLWSRNNQAASEDVDALAAFAVQIIKGVAASLMFAVAFYAGTKYFRLGLGHGLVMGYIVWTLAWFVLFRA